MIPKDTVDKIYDSIDIVEVLGDFVELKKKGRNMWACCPFHNEKTPSFSVAPEKGIYKCFGCGVAGDSVKFVMEHEGMSYVEALRYLAGKYNIEIVEVEASPEQQQQKSEKDNLYIVLDYAKAYYRNNLENNPMGQAIGKSYFRERGFTENTIEAFDLGYSMDEWDGLSKKAQKDHHNIETLEKAGLLRRKEDRVYDYFRGRVIFPIHNLSGKVIAFGARILTNDKSQPKYLNSPETEVYKKSKVLYGIYQAKNAIRQQDNCYLVEGYTDVISLYQAGVQNVVGSSGTSLTEGQVRLVNRFTKNITVLYDGDSAGLKASMRGVDIILSEGMDVHAVSFPEGEDPDSYVRKIGSSAFQKYLEENRQDFISFKVSVYLAEAGNDPVKKAEAISEIVESIAKVPDGIRQAVFIQQCANLLGVSEDVLNRELDKKLNRNIQQERKRQEREARRAQNKPTQPSSQGLPPDLPPEDIYVPIPDEYLAQEAGLPPVVDHGNKSTHKSEWETIRFLIHYGAIELDDGSFLGQFLLQEIAEVEFKDARLAQIVSVYREKLEEGVMAEPKHFLQSPDEETKQVIVEMLADVEDLSEGWEQREIYVSDESKDLSKALVNGVLRLKWRKVRQMLKDNQPKLLEAKTPEETMEAIQEYQQLKQMEAELAKMLGIVVG